MRTASRENLITVAQIFLFFFLAFFFFFGDQSERNLPGMPVTSPSAEWNWRCINIIKIKYDGWQLLERDVCERLRLLHSYRFIARRVSEMGA